MESGHRPGCGILRGSHESFAVSVNVRGRVPRVPALCVGRRVAGVVSDGIRRVDIRQLSDRKVDVQRLVDHLRVAYACLRQLISKRKAHVRATSKICSTLDALKPLYSTDSGTFSGILFRQCQESTVDGRFAAETTLTYRDIHANRSLHNNCYRNSENALSCENVGNRVI